MRFISIARTLQRYWRMANDPRTPKGVKYLIIGGIVYTVLPAKLKPNRGEGLMDDSTILPLVIALSMILIPPRVKDAHDAQEEKQIEASKQEGPGYTPQTVAPAS